MNKALFLTMLCTCLSNVAIAQASCDRAGFSNGWMLHMNNQEVDQITQACAATNAKYFRTDFAWSDVQWNGSNSWYWNNIDRLVASSNAQGMEMIAIATYFPPWAGPTTDTTFWYNFVYQAGMRYIPQGVTIWEMWNEPNLINFWPGPNVSDYVDKILKPGSNAIRQAAADLGTTVTVLSAGLAPAATNGTNISQIDFFTGIYTHGGKDYFDHASNHPYCWPLAPGQQSFYNWFLKTQDFRTVMLNNGDSAKKIWGTEMGWPTHQGQNGITEAQQAQYLTDAYQIWDSWDWTGPLIWYAYNDGGTDPTDSESNFGIVRNDFSPKPALAAFQTMIANCNGNTLELKLALEGCYNASDGLMLDLLRDRQVLPLQDPYGLSNDISATAYSVTGQNALVDWVQIELRDGNTVSTILQTVSGVVQRDGDVVASDGVSPLSVDASLPTSVYIVVRHQSHLPVMSLGTVGQINRVYSYDFTSGNSYTGGGAGQVELLPGFWGMFTGNALTDNDINGQDNILWSTENGLFNIYSSTDFNMNADVNSADRILWIGNNGRFSQVP